MPLSSTYRDECQHYKSLHKGTFLSWFPCFFAFDKRSRNFADFSMKLKCLLTQYDIPGDKYGLLAYSCFEDSSLLWSFSNFCCFFFSEIKLKLLASLQYLGKDLQQISNLPRWVVTQMNLSGLSVKTKMIRSCFHDKIWSITSYLRFFSHFLTWHKLNGEKIKSAFAG